MTLRGEFLSVALKPSNNKGPLFGPLITTCLCEANWVSTKSTQSESCLSMSSSLLCFPKATGTDPSPFRIRASSTTFKPRQSRNLLPNLRTTKALIAPHRYPPQISEPPEMKALSQPHDPFFSQNPKPPLRQINPWKQYPIAQASTCLHQVDSSRLSLNNRRRAHLNRTQASNHSHGLLSPYSPLTETSASQTTNSRTATDCWAPTTINWKI